MAAKVKEMEITYDAPAATASPRQHLQPSSPAAQVVRAYLRQQTDRLKSLDPLVRADEPDSVHQMRVAVRRLRSTLRTFRDIIGPAGAGRLASELKWLGGVLGEVRDAEVLNSHLRHSLDHVPVEQSIGPVQARVQGHFARVRAAAREEALAALDSPRYLAILDDLDTLVAMPEHTREAAQAAKDALPAAVRRPAKQARRRMRKAWAKPAGEPRDLALHQARKSAKRARYAAEAASPALGKQARRFAKQMKKVQSTLGDHQDAVIGRRAARELGIAAHLAGENAFTYGLLHERDTVLADRSQAKARRVWQRASRSRYRRWLR